MVMMFSHHYEDWSQNNVGVGNILDFYLENSFPLPVKHAYDTCGLHNYDWIWIKTS